jgi:hypothetical protein
MNLLFGQMGNNGVPADERVVRNTATPVLQDAPPAVQPEAPVWNEPIESDQNPNLGLVNRTLASHWVEGEQYAPFWSTSVDDQWQHNNIVDRQVSSSGTAAAREAAGHFGHGTASYAVGIEPVQTLQGSGGFGNEYLSAGKPPIQGPAGNYMSVPPGYDGIVTQDVMATGKVAARQANQGDTGPNIYDLFWNGGK